MQQWRYAEKIILTLLAGMGLMISCNKNNFLNKKPSSDLVVPSTLMDFQALLDNDLVMQETPELGELSTDDFYLDSGVWQNLDVKEHNAYVWASDIYGGQGGVEDWDDPYQQVFYANVVLDGLPNVMVNSSNAQMWNSLQGTAYFIRAYAFYNLAQLFAPVYNSATASKDLGIPLRLSSAINQVSVRASVKNTYDTIVAELQTASALLPRLPDSTHLNRPSKTAALAMLARVYLSMNDYTNAWIYADSCLKIYSPLIDYNAVPLYTKRSLSMTNKEIIYQSHLLSTSGVLGAISLPCIVDSNLYRSYADSDLRKYILFDKVKGPSGVEIIIINTGYSGPSVHFFTGLATDEVYLIRAECSVRDSRPGDAASDLNSLLVNRMAYDSVVYYSSSTATVDAVLTERRKELVFRGLRWTDLRRLNISGSEIGLNRFGNPLDTLKPNDPRYVLPIPPDVPGLIPNKR
jgi:hypothetical protein